MKNILITGSSGFLGTTLSKRLEELDFTVLPITRNMQGDQLLAKAKVADYCFHLAGEVNPNASEEQFYSANVELTKILLKTLECRPISVVFSSTIHAGQTNNAYGNTKLEAERLISDYGNKHSIPVHICKLPHLFGIGAKPDHNSILATWIRDAIHGKELVVFDENHTINYMCVDELVDYFVAQMKLSERLPLPRTYPIKLGELRDMIVEMAVSRRYKPKTIFSEKLYKVFESVQSSV